MKKRRASKTKKPRIIFVLFIFAILLIDLGIYFQFTGFSLKGNIDVKKSFESLSRTPHVYSADMVMVGDALIHSSIYVDAKQSDGTYNFLPMLELTKPITEKFDLAYYNQETILGGPSFGYSNYPRFNSPTEVGDAFIDSGFNLVSLATNHTMDKGEAGVLKSVEYWKSKTGIVTAGQYSSQEERDMVRTYEVNGISYAFFSYTTWTNGLETPTGKEYLNNVYSEEKAKVDIEKVRDKVDVVMVAMHWGTEYSMGVSEEQTEIANYLSSLGVDIIIGAHPHVVEPVEYINNGKTFVIYSLGNYISDQIGIERLTGLMMQVTIRKVVDSDGNVDVSIINPKAELLYTKSSNSGKRNFKVYPYSQLNNTLLPNYMSYYNKYKAVVSERYPDLVWGIDGE